MKISLNRPQMSFIKSRARHSLYLAGRGSGKTFVGCLWAICRMLKTPGTAGLIGANIPRQLNNVVLRQLFSLLRDMGIAHCYGKKPPWVVGDDRDASYSGVLSLPNGSRAYCRSMHRSGIDNNIRGLQLAWIYVDEARDLEEESFDVALACLRGFPGADYMTRLTSTPSGFNWLFEKFGDADSERLMPGSEMIKGRTSDNWRHLPEDYEASLRATYSKQLARQELDGEFVNLRSGQVFQFDRKVHVRPLDFNPDWPLIFSADQNVSPYCGVVLQVDRRERKAHVLDEIRMSDNGTTMDWAREASRRFKDRATSVEFHCDPSSVRRDTRGGESDFILMRNELDRHFRHVRDASDRNRRSVEDGVNAVNAMLDPSEGEPRLFVDPKCQELIKDLERLQYKEGTRDIDKSDKERSHMADSLRYPLAQEFPVGGTRITTVNLW